MRGVLDTLAGTPRIFELSLAGVSVCPFSSNTARLTYFLSLRTSWRQAFGLTLEPFSASLAPVAVKLADGRRQILEKKYGCELRSQIHHVVKPGKDRAEGALKVAAFYREKREKPSAEAIIRLIDQSRTLGRAVLASGTRLSHNVCSHIT